LIKEVKNMFEHGNYHTHHRHDGCCRPGNMHRHHFHRRFMSREEKIARLEDYQKELRVEAKAVEEHLEDLKKAA
jgi:hypothetical protein